MRIAVFSTRPYDREFFDTANADRRHELVYFETRLDPLTAPLARGLEGICAFSHDVLQRSVIHALAGGARDWSRCAVLSLLASDLGPSRSETFAHGGIVGRPRYLA